MFMYLVSKILLDGVLSDRYIDTDLHACSTHETYMCELFTLTCEVESAPVAASLTLGLTVGPLGAPPLEKSLQPHGGLLGKWKNNNNKLILNTLSFLEVEAVTCIVNYS